MRPARKSDPAWLLAPMLVALAVFFVYPLLSALHSSFFEWDLLTPPRYVGLANYSAILESGDLLASLGTTLLISAIVVTGSMLLGLGLALAVHRPGRLAAFARSAVFSAYVVSWVAVGLLFLWIFDKEAGVVNRTLVALGATPVKWLTSTSVAPLTVALIVIWKVTGYAMVVFLSGLSALPPEVKEAAAIDGAGPLARLRHVTLPLLRPTAAFVATTSLIASFQLFDVVRLLTQGGPVRSTTVLVYAIYEQLFLDLRVGRASALVVVFFFVLGGLTWLKLRAFRTEEPA
ncbi:MAG TPA: sugar ABC transporter permease [Polyangiaceae bacterium]|nr:sugar ABC transporter permease [Polyangiaceae bacterium]